MLIITFRHCFESSRVVPIIRSSLQASCQSRATCSLLNRVDPIGSQICPSDAMVPSVMVLLGKTSSCPGDYTSSTDKQVRWYDTGAQIQPPAHELLEEHFRTPAGRINTYVSYFLSVRTFITWSWRGSHRPTVRIGLEQGFTGVNYELFKDRDTLPTCFVNACSM